MLPSQQELSNLLGILYEAAANPSLWEPFIAQLARRTEATSAALVIHNFNNACCTVGSSWRLDPESDRVYQQHYHTVDLWAARRTSISSGACVTSESVWPLRDMRETEFYNEFLLKSGIEYAMFGLMENSESRLAAVSLYRDRSRSEFTESNLRILRFLAPHLQRAFKLHFQLSAAKAQSAGFEAALDMLPTGIIMLGRRGDIVSTNERAASVMAENDGLLAIGNLLRAERAVESEHLTAMVESAVSMSARGAICAGGAIPISRRTRPPLQVVIGPLRNARQQTFQKIAAIAFVHDPLRCNRPAEGALRTLYGLTPAECRIALLLSDGHAPRQIAAMVGVTENTIRSQIKSIYGKTGVKRQSELMRLLMNLAGPSMQTDPIR